MARFSYHARNAEGNPIRGVVEAANENVAADILLDHALTVISLEEQRLPFWRRSFTFFDRVSARDRALFFRQLSVLVSANVPIVQGLRVLTEQVANRTLKRIVTELAEEVDGGAKLSQGMDHFPRVFSSLERRIIETGETSGKLDEVLEYLASQEERDYDLITRVRGAMIYPAVVVTGLVVVGVVVMVFVMPKLIEILEETGAKLPLPTRILIGVSNILINWWILIIVGVLGLVVGLWMFARTPYGRWHVSYLLLHVPIFGKLLQRLYLVRFCRSLRTLIVGGVSVTRSLAIVANVVGNIIYKQIIEATIKEVEDGNSITTMLAKSKVVPPMVPQMMAIGETTGKLDDVLDRITTFYTREIDNTIQNLNSLIEPVIIIVIGIGVGTLIAAVILPIYNLASVAA